MGSYSLTGACNVFTVCNLGGHDTTPNSQRLIIKAVPTWSRKCESGSAVLGKAGVGNAHRNPG